MTDDELTKIDEAAKAAVGLRYDTAKVEIRSGIGVPDRHTAMHIAAANPQTVIALVAEVRRLRGIVGALAASNPEEYDSYQGPGGAGLRCALCGKAGWEKDIPTNVPMPLHLHAADCPYRLAVSEQQPGGK